MLTGSYATGGCISISDFDIIILSKNINYIYSEFLFNKLNIHLIFLPYFKIQSLITSDIINGQGMYTRMFREGYILKDDTKKTLKRIKDYVMADEYFTYGNEQENLALIYKITKNLKVITSDTSDVEKYFCASEILLDTSRLISHKYKFNGKHLARLVQADKVGIDIIAAFQRLIGANETEEFASVVSEAIDKFGGLQDKYTTGWVYTYPASDNMMVLFPSQSFTNPEVLGYINTIREIAKGCFVHAFYVGKNQSMEEGIYVYLFSETTSFPKLLSNLNLFRETAALDMLKCGIQCTFPYKTLFHAGVSFGGKFILKRLLPHFHSIWSVYYKLIVRNSHSINKVSKIFATLLLIEIRPRLAELQLSGNSFFREFCESLVLEAVDPSGLYNLIQMKAARIATLRWYAETYDNNIDNYRNLILAINQNTTAGICQLRKCIIQLLEVIQLIDNNEILLPNIYNSDNKREVLLMNVCNHIMSIFQLTPTDKFGVIYNYSRYNRYYDI